MIYTEKSTDKYIMERRMEKFMSKVAVVYWSGTGNTEAMATAVAEGAQEKGAEVSLMFCGEFGADRMDEFDAVTASSAMRRRTGTRCPTVRLWARRWCREYGHFAQNDKLAFSNILVRMIKLE